MCTRADKATGTGVGECRDHVHHKKALNGWCLKEYFGISVSTICNNIALVVVGMGNYRVISLNTHTVWY